MNFIIADTFQRALTRLNAAEQAAVKQAAFDFQMNPAAPGFSFERCDRSRDPNFWAFRVSGDLRIIVHRASDSFTLCHADHHDSAYRWAERRKLEAHPQTGAAQIVEFVEREVVREIVRHVEKEPPVFAQYEDGYLLALGVPAEWLDAVKRTTLSTLPELIDKLPEEACERLLALADGKPVARPVDRNGASPFAHPDAQRRFRIVDTRDELRAALDYPWEKWVVFLHPSQRKTVERRYNGPALVTGAAGTGKSVVALHRAAWLARQNENARVLVTTFTRTLAVRLSQNADLLMGADSPERQRVSIEHLHKLARDIWVGEGKTLQIATAKDVSALLAEASNGAFPLAFLRSEWESVVDPWGIWSWEEYRAASRTRRGTPLGARQKLAIWKIFEQVRNQMRGRLFTWSDLCYAVVERIERSIPESFDHVIADEAQDLGPAEVRLLRALVRPASNDIFLCCDAGQRIYRSAFSWRSAAVDVRGRSSRLKLNYRTTEAIRRFSDSLLPGNLEEADESVAQRDSISLLTGPKPEVKICPTLGSEIESVAAWIRELLQAGFEPRQIAVFGRTDQVIRERVVPAIQQAGAAGRALNDNEPASATEVAYGTMHRAKGLEFRAVAVMGCDAGAIPPESLLAGAEDAADKDSVIARERQLLYVACSRARERLLVTCTGAPSSLIGVKSKG